LGRNCGLVSMGRDWLRNLKDAKKKKKKTKKKKPASVNPKTSR